jgi:hypothetical protein
MVDHENLIIENVKMGSIFAQKNQFLSMWKLTLGYGSLEPALRQLVKSLTTGTKDQEVLRSLSPKDSWCIDVLENLPCFNKTKHPQKRGRERNNMDGTQVEAKRRN